MFLLSLPNFRFSGGLYRGVLGSEEERERADGGRWFLFFILLKCFQMYSYCPTHNFRDFVVVEIPGSPFFQCSPSWDGGLLKQSGCPPAAAGPGGRVVSKGGDPRPLVPGKCAGLVGALDPTHRRGGGAGSQGASGRGGGCRGVCASRNIPSCHCIAGIRPARVAGRA